MKTVHIVSIPESCKPDAQRRYSMACSTWKNFYDFGIIPVHILDSELKRSSLDLGDTRKLPFLKDLISIGIEQHKPDIIIFTNADICVSSSVTESLSEKLGQRDCCYAKRRNFPRIEQEIESDKIKEGTEEPYGVDLFAFTRNWWNEYQIYIPDMLVGVHKWDIVLSDLISITTPLAEIKDIIYHEIHEYFWSNPANFLNNPGQKHNQKISEHCYSKYRILRYVAGLIRNEFPDRNMPIGSMEYELQGIFQKESNLLKFFCNYERPN